MAEPAARPALSDRSVGNLGPTPGFISASLFDALRVKIRDEGLVRNKAVYVALAITAEGHKKVLRLWIEQTEGAKLWLRVMNELKTRSLGDILIAVADGLNGFPVANRALGCMTPPCYHTDPPGTCCG